MKPKLFLFFSLFINITFSQEKIYTTLDRMPVYTQKCYSLENILARNDCSNKELNDTLKKLILKNIDTTSSSKKWPKNKVFIRFIVDKDGSILLPEIIKSSGNKSIDSLALANVKNLKKYYTPGFYHNKTVKTQLIVTFDLNFEAKVEDILNFMENIDKQ